MPTSIRTAQSGSTLRIVTIPSGPRANGGRDGGARVVDRARRRRSPSPRAARRARTSRAGRASRARPARAGSSPGRADLHGGQALGGDHALAGDRQRHGAADPLAGRAGAAGVGRRPRRAAPTRPCAGARAAPAPSPSTTARPTACGSAPRRGRRAPARRRPGRPAASRAHARAPAKPVVPPEVETRTSVLRRSRWRNSRASSSSVAVARQLGAGRAAARVAVGDARRSAGSDRPGPHADHGLEVVAGVLACASA